MDVKNAQVRPTLPQPEVIDKHSPEYEAAKGFEIGNIDSTIVAQAPKMAPHVPALVARIAEALGIEPARVNVKAKTAEKMGPVGEGRAIETRAVCLLAALS